MGAWALALLVLCSLGGCAKAPLTRESYVFGTRVEIIVADAPAAVVEAGISAVLREFDRLHRSYHAWQPSQLTAVNEAFAAGRPQTVTPELAALISEAQRLAAAGDYLFDPGIGELIRLWGFHADEFVARLPPAAALAAWRKAAPSLADVTVDGTTVRSRKPGVALDFGGYLKGVALDRAAAILKQQGINNALINIGGNVLALGSKNGEPWRVGIQQPRGAGVLATVALRDGEAIGTSGDYQRYFELDGRRYCHLLDPRTARPVDHTQAVTVLISPPAALGDGTAIGAGTLSDAASKPLFVAGPQGWRQAARQLGVSQALRIDSQGLTVTTALAQRLHFVGTPPPLTVID